MYTARKLGFSLFSAMNSMQSSVHLSLTDSPCWLGGRNVQMHSWLSGSVSCQGAMARGWILSVCSWVHSAMCEIHVDRFFLVHLSFLWLMRWVGSRGGCVYDSFHQVSGMIQEIMGWSLFRQERQRASISSL